MVNFFFPLFYMFNLWISSSLAAFCLMYQWKPNNNLHVAGFPRTEKQAINLMASYPVDIALNIVVPFEVIVERVQGRWVHLPSGRVYNTGFKPPNKPVSSCEDDSLSHWVTRILIMIVSILFTGPWWHHRWTSHPKRRWQTWSCTKTSWSVQEDCRAAVWLLQIEGDLGRLSGTYIWANLAGITEVFRIKNPAVISQLRCCGKFAISCLAWALTGLLLAEHPIELVLYFCTVMFIS